MASRTVPNALRAGSLALEATAAGRSSSVFQRRAFSASPASQVQVITFSPTSSPELDADLATIRDKILLPSYLHADQRKMLHKVKYQAKLRSEPITMELDGERLRFEYSDPTKGTLPNTRDLMFSAIDKMQTPADWDNLPRLLEGLHSRAGRRLAHFDYPKMTRKAGTRGCIYAIVECARQVRKTGFKLDTSEKVNSVLFWLQVKAVDSGFDAEETAKALTWAEMVLTMLEEEKHQPRWPKAGAFPLGRDPQVVANALNLAASLAVKHRGGEDVDGKVERYARDVVGLWPAGKGLMDLHPKELYDDRKAMWYLSDANICLAYAAPLLHGMETAMKVVDAGLAKELDARRSGLAAELQRIVADGKVKGRGRYVYEKLFGSESA